MSTPPPDPKIYHIVHADRLVSIIRDGFLWSDARMAGHAPAGTVIGMSKIKARRLATPLASHPGLHVGECVPFYFCPRSIMLYVISQVNHEELSYRGGQEPIVHLEADLRQAVDWASREGRRWAFTLSNAGAAYVEDRSDLGQLNEIDWDAVQASIWRDCKDRKQAEFLVEEKFPWELVRRIGVRSPSLQSLLVGMLRQLSPHHQPPVETLPGWYY